MNNDVFISYSHVNSVVADAICHHFEESGVRCWYAPRNIQPGDEWADAIIKAIKSSRMLVLVFSSESNDSAQVRREIGAAMNAGIPIVPFKITDAVPTGSMEYYLNTLHWLDAVDQPLEEAIDRLLVMCKAILEAEEATKTDAVGQGEADAGSGAKAGKVAPPAAAAATAKRASTETTSDGGSSKRGLFIAIGVIAVLAICIIGAVASGAFSGEDSSTSTSVGTSTSNTQQSTTSAASASSTSSSTNTITTTTDGGAPNTEAIDWAAVETHHELPYVVADDESFIVVFGGYHMVGEEPISEFLFYNKTGTSVLLDATVNVVANGIDIPEYSISKTSLKPGEYRTLSGFYKGTDANGKKVPMITGALKSMQSEVVITPWRKEDIVLADYPVKWEADDSTAANARKLDLTVIDDKNFCAMRVTDVSELHGGYVLMHYSYMNRIDEIEKIEFGDDWRVNGQSAVVVGAPTEHVTGQGNNFSILLYVPEGDRDAAVTSVTGTVNVGDRYRNPLVSQVIELSFDM